MKFMPMGPYPVEVALCLTDADWRKSLEKHTFVCAKPKAMPKSEACVTEFVNEDRCRLLVVTFQPRLKLRDVWARASIVAHEATHIWQYICQHIGEPSPGDEIEACSIQWIAHWLFDRLDDAGYLTETP